MARSVAGVVCGKRTKWIVLGLWVILMAGFGPLAGKLSNAQDNQTSNWLPGSAESTKAYHQLGRFIDRDMLPAIVVYERTSGITAADVTKTANDARSLADVKDVRGKVVGPIRSQDGKAIQLVVPLHVDPQTGWNDLPDVVKEIKRTATTGAGGGLTVRLGGPASFGADQASAFSNIDGVLLFATLGVVIVILLLTYRSPTLWFLPLLCAVVALTAAQAFIYLLVKHTSLTVNGQSYGILTVLVIGAGTDYALLLVARYREELRRHEDRHEAMALAMHRAGPAILASGTTVVLGMLCLLAAEMNSTKGLGPVAALGIVFSLAAMLTLLPALLVILGRWVFWPRRPSFGSPEPTATGPWARVGHAIRPRPRQVWVVTVGILAVAALGSFKLNANGLTLTDSFVGTPDSVKAGKILDAHFSSNAGDPVYVLVNSGKASETVSALEQDSDLSNVATPVTKGDRSLVSATLKGDAYSPRAAGVIKDVRKIVHGIPGADAAVGGTSATNLDIQNASHRDDEVIIPLTLLVVLLILGLLLRALVAPVILIATVVLSFAAAMGLSALVFHYIFGFGGADSSLPLFVFVFLVALGIDYNIFLMTRVREESAKVGTRRGALIGLAATGGVITSAGVVLAATFTVLASIPIVFLAEMGFAVALGILLDTIVVRAILVTAINLDVGSRIWLPGKLSKVPDQELADPDAPDPELVEAHQ